MPWFNEDHDVKNEIKSRNLSKGKFLVLGIGPGTQAMQLATLEFNVTGSDLSQSAIDKAKQLYSEPHYVVDDILNSKFSDNEFDFIFDRGIFHIFEQEPRPVYLSQFKRILKENGILFLKCMSIDEKNLPEGKRPFKYSKEQIKQFFGKYFEIESISNTLFFGTVAPPPKSIFAVIKNKKN